MQMTSSSPPQIFCKKTLKHHRHQSYSLQSPTDYLLSSVETNLLSRLKDFKGNFKDILTLGFRSTSLKDFETSCCPGIRLLNASPLAVMPCAHLVFDEENLPLAPQKFDAILSALHLHNVNDLPGSLVQLYQSLRPRGFFGASFYGGDSLKELRRAFLSAEISLKNGLSPRFSPLIEMKEGAHLLRRAGFSDVISESITFQLLYESPLELCYHLKELSETNSLLARQKGLTSPRLFKAAFEQYELLKDCFPLTFEIIYSTGWRFS